MHTRVIRCLSIVGLLLAVVLSESQAQVTAPASGGVDQKLAALRESFQAAVERQAIKPRSDAIAALRKNFVGPLDRALASATQSGRLAEAVALRDEKQHVENGEPV